ncbi:hypothetical protein [Halorubellus sp. PRR65]|uniref:hypothetical protein n=1 Tax=Halorubellus sp. PRR65 TaxID=3098148 RepID=UPI002B25BE3C|nr:hypothetical protein [Halorubellus sp. PRR65]
MPTERRAPAGRATAFLASSSAAAWWLGAAVGVATWFGLGEVVGIPDFVPWLLGGAVGACVYYHVRYPWGLLWPDAPSARVGYSLFVAAWAWLTSVPDDASARTMLAVGVAWGGVWVALVASARVAVLHDGDADVASRSREAESGDGDIVAVVASVRESRAGRTVGRWLAACRSFLQSSSATAWWLGAAASVVAWWTVEDVVAVDGVVPWVLLLGLGPSVYYHSHYDMGDAAPGTESWSLERLFVTSATFPLTPGDSPFGVYAVTLLALFALVEAGQVAIRLDALGLRPTHGGDAGKRVDASASRDEETTA